MSSIDWFSPWSALVVWFVVVIIGLVLYEPRMVYYPHVPSRQLEKTPDSLGLTYRDVELHAADGVRLHSWFISPSASVADAGQTLLLLHGNAGNISHRLEKCRTFTELGLNVLALDYRGYGQSEGRPSERGLYADAKAAYTYLTEQLHILPLHIVVYGESLGTGVAVDLATRVKVGGLILEAPFTSIPDVAQRIFWFLPVRFFVRNRFDSHAKIGRIGTPLLILHSQQDEIFSLRHALRLQSAAQDPKQLIELNGSHANAFAESVEVAQSAIATFLTTLARE